MLVVLAGQPNSGKSALLSRLTGARVVTSNYPGTTVEVLKGTLKTPLGVGDITVLDTPGVYSLAASSKEQEVTRAVLQDARPDLIVNVVDSTNLARHLSLTLSLIECGVPVLVALNSSDRLKSKGLEIDLGALQEKMGVQAVLTSALTGEGVEDLRELIVRSIKVTSIKGQGSPAGAGKAVMPAPSAAGCPVVTEAHLRRYQSEAERIAAVAVLARTESPGAGSTGRRKDLGRLCDGLRDTLDDRLDRPAFSILVLGVVLLACWRLIAWALPLAEVTVRAVLAPVSDTLARLLRTTLPDGHLAEILADAVPEGFVLPLATVLPAMIVAYTLIAVLEDSGLLGRYAAFGDAVTRALNLPGQALIPFVLAFGCRVPALMAARILPSSKSRKAASFVIATVVPCTATISLAFTALARFGASPLIPGIAVVSTLLLLGPFLRLTWGGVSEPLVLEIPPLRLPMLKNVLMKTQMRLSGFFAHVLPLVVGMNVGVRIITSSSGAAGGPAFAHFARHYLGIPPEALWAVMLTMFQRYLAPLFLLHLHIGPREATIAVTMVVLGLPCLPSMVTMWRELGFRMAAFTFLASACLSLAWAMALNLVI
jgi:ferrous iron transport protein B